MSKSSERTVIGINETVEKDIERRAEDTKDIEDVATRVSEGRVKAYCVCVVEEDGTMFRMFWTKDWEAAMTLRGLVDTAATRMDGEW